MGNMKSLYRKYRPRSLAEVVGQPQVTEPLGNALKAGKVGHAYLFIGPRGCGKTSVARILAHEVNGFKYELEDEYVDIIEIDGASNRGIDNIRELREKVAIAPTAGKYKVYIIDEVHMLTKEAFNALLKTLEEPPEHVIFIMATTDAYKVPVTITSRAQTYTFKLADAGVMQTHLKGICEKEGIKITDDALEIVVKRGGGSFRDSLSLLDQISTLTDGEITKELVITAMGLPEDTKVNELFNAYKSGEMAKIGVVLKDLLSSGIKPETLAEELITKIVTEPQVELMPLLAKLPDIKAPYAEAKLLVALAPEMRDKASDSSASWPRPSGPSPRADGATSRAAALRSATIAENPDAGGQYLHIGENSNHGMIQKDDDALAGKTNFVNAENPDTGVSTASDSSNFNWGEFVERVRDQDAGIASQLASVDYEVAGGTLNIYPNKSFLQKTLARDKNKAILIAAADGLKVVINDAGAAPNSKKDALISKMSDIMGGEVQNDAGGNPF